VSGNADDVNSLDLSLPYLSHLFIAQSYPQTVCYSTYARYQNGYITTLKIFRTCFATTLSPTRTPHTLIPTTFCALQLSISRKDGQPILRSRRSRYDCAGAKTWHMKASAHCKLPKQATWHLPRPTSRPPTSRHPPSSPRHTPPVEEARATCNPIFIRTSLAKPKM
jgi:hypothetical protein